MIEHVCRQGSLEWEKLRRGIPTASRFHQIYQAKRRKPSIQRHVYLLELLDEWLTGTPAEKFQNTWTKRGQDLEPMARFDFTMQTGLAVREVGFVSRDDGLVGGSPDGLIADDEVLEIKVYSPQVHAELSQKNPKHTAQTQGLLYICERERCNLYLYNDKGESVRKVIERDDSYLADFIPCLNEFISELESEKLSHRHARAS